MSRNCTDFQTAALRKRSWILNGIAIITLTLFVFGDSGQEAKQDRKMKAGANGKGRKRWIAH
jgi:hypothetical protein